MCRRDKKAGENRARQILESTYVRNDQIIQATFLLCSTCHGRVIAVHIVSSLSRPSRSNVASRDWGCWAHGWFAPLPYPRAQLLSIPTYVDAALRVTRVHDDTDSHVTCDVLVFWFLYLTPIHFVPDGALHACTHMIFILRIFRSVRPLISADERVDTRTSLPLARLTAARA